MMRSDTGCERRNISTWKTLIDAERKRANLINNLASADNGSVSVSLFLLVCNNNLLCQQMKHAL